MNILCRIGIHKYILRELQYDEKPTANPTHLMTILERCQCGNVRIAPHGDSLPTTMVASTKFIDR